MVFYFILTLRSKLRSLGGIPHSDGGSKIALITSLKPGLQECQEVWTQLELLNGKPSDDLFGMMVAGYFGIFMC